MKTRIQRRWVVFWACFLVALLGVITLTDGANVTLTAYVSYSLLGQDGQPLQDGSYVMIFGSTDGINHGPTEWLNSGSYIAESTQGGDVFLGWVRIGEPSYMGSNGTFYTAGQITFDNSVITHLYLRFFDTTDWPEGDVVWGTSPSPISVTGGFGEIEVDFGGNFQATQTNHFVIIPEPSSAHLLLLFVGLVAGMHSSFRKSKTTQTAGKTVVGKTSERK